MSDKLKEPPSSRDSTMEAKNTVEIPLTSSDGKEEGTTPKKAPSSVDWDVLRSYKGGLKLAQVVVGIIILGLEHPRPNNATPDYILFFATLNATIVTVVVLVDLLSTKQPPANDLGAKLWARVELRYAGFFALVLHCLAYWVLIGAINLYTVPVVKILSSVFAFVASGLYLADFWRLWRLNFGGAGGIAPEQLVVETS
ncbi:uncharacterized protein LOC128732336 [Sabethes cyaneus]|uniref:uncharacterized protein LOC128732336 n=1 Tax=Sabethes cyaneus TaxID=53552 RepID=UPI00237E2B01|nr:uncharacterized protein LOC128732336 [Sabethes cyaneus]